MSTLQVTTIQSNSTTAPPTIQNSAGTEYGRFCRAWVNFNGTTASPSTIRASFNVSSVTKNGTGDYTVNFTNAMTDANYSAVCWDSAWGLGWYDTPQTTSLQIHRVNTSYSGYDSTFVTFAIFR